MLTILPEDVFSNQNFMLSFDLVHCVALHTFLQANCDPPTHSADNEAIFAFLLLLWAAIQRAITRCRDYMNEIEGRGEERHKICMLGPLCCL